MDYEKAVHYSSADDEFLDPETLVFTLFCFNPYWSKEKVLQELKQLHHYLEVELRPYQKYYPWNVKPVQFELVENGLGEPAIPFIYGSLNYGDSMDDLWIVTSLLFKFTSRDPNLFVHVFDQDKEFVLIEAAYDIPEWISPTSASNRVWFNNRKVMLIPEDYCHGRSLDLSEALAFLKIAAYKLEYPSALNETLLKTKFNIYPEEALKHIYLEQVSVSNKLATLLRNNPIYLPGAAINHFVKQMRLFPVSFSSQPTLNTLSKDYLPIDHQNLVQIKLRMAPISHLNLQKLCEGAKTSAGDVIARAIDSLLSESAEINMNTTASETLEQYNARVEGDELQKELLRYNVIGRAVDWEDLEAMETPKGVSQSEKDKDESQLQDDLVEKLRFFIGQETDWTGVDKRESDSDDDSDYSTDTENQRLRDYFKKEGVDIDEDDFFEFFCKEALKMNDKDLEAFRNNESGHGEGQVEQVGQVEDFEEVDGPEQEEDADIEVLTNMLKSLRETGGLDGPVATLLRGLDVDPDQFVSN